MERVNESSSIRVSTAIWKQSGPSAFEFATIDRTDGGHLLAGDIVVGDNNDALAIAYSIIVNSLWETANVQITTKEGTEAERRIELLPDSDRRWSARRSNDGDWSRLPEYDGLIDIDLGCTPATNLLPIRRFNLAIGESAETTAVWVMFPSLELEPLAQRYTRLSEREYLYESFLSGFKANLRVDEFGVVDRYSDIWTRLNAVSPGPP